ncbi:hypothetical protein EDD85DRAFT_785116 [Armillaria nabsnona]|nr:hypothetical protein EDD85DRAFT_785116 [Armillaria nabsnona]
MSKSPNTRQNGNHGRKTSFWITGPGSKSTRLATTSLWLYYQSAARSSRKCQGWNKGNWILFLKARRMYCHKEARLTSVWVIWGHEEGALAHFPCSSSGKSAAAWIATTDGYNIGPREMLRIVSTNTITIFSYSIIVGGTFATIKKTISARASDTTRDADAGGRNFEEVEIKIILRPPNHPARPCRTAEKRRFMDGPKLRNADWRPSIPSEAGPGGSVCLLISDGDQKSESLATAAQNETVWRKDGSHVVRNACQASNLQILLEARGMSQRYEIRRMPNMLLVSVERNETMYAQQNQYCRGVLLFLPVNVDKSRARIFLKIRLGLIQDQRYM